MLTLEECMVKHRLMWDWLSKHPGCYKSDVPLIEKEKERYILNSCFLCAWATSKFLEKYEVFTISDFTFCEFCPVRWPGCDIPPFCMSENAYYLDWVTLTYNHRWDGDKYAKYLLGETESEPDRFKQITALAEKIRDLPLKPQYENHKE